jgi:hypothetical protein
MNILNKGLQKTCYILRGKVNLISLISHSKFIFRSNEIYNKCLKSYTSSTKNSFPIMSLEDYEKIINSINLEEQNLNLDIGPETMLNNLFNNTDSLERLLEKSQNDEYLKEEISPKIIKYFSLGFSNLTQVQNQINSQIFRSKLNSILCKFINIAMSIKIEDKNLWDSFYQIYIQNIENLGKNEYKYINI